MIRILTGDCRDVLPTLDAGSVHCVVTSPPYYALRSYLDAAHPDKHREIGSEPTPDEYLQTMVEVFREVRRVLRPDGTCWVNMGDSYAGGHTTYEGSQRKWQHGEYPGRSEAGRVLGAGLAPKQLLMMPARLALALQADGWWLRSDIIWAKPNPMPESVRDRPVNSYEHVFLLAKSPRYFYDAIAIAEPAASNETLHLLSDREAGDRVRQGQAGQGRSDEGMPLLRYIEDAQMASNARRAGEVAGSYAQAQFQTGETGQTEGIQPLGEASSHISSVAEDGGRSSIRQSVSVLAEAQGCAETLLREREGTSDDQSLSGDRQGQSKSDAWRPQASRSDEDIKHTDGAGMGCDQGESQPQVPLLQEDDQATDDGSRDTAQQGRPSHSDEHRAGMQKLQQPQGQPNGAPAVRSARNVWTIATAPFSAAHFATFPPELAERCIKAGTSERGCCAQCGKPWVRQARPTLGLGSYNDHSLDAVAGMGAPSPNKLNGQQLAAARAAQSAAPSEWSLGCTCNAATVPCTVLDPFSGAGTTGLVADRLGRDAVMIDLNHQYVEMARARLQADCPLFADITDAPVASEDAYDRDMRDLFAEAAE